MHHLSSNSQSPWVFIRLVYVLFSCLYAVSILAGANIYFCFQFCISCSLIKDYVLIQNSLEGICWPLGFSTDYSPTLSCSQVNTDMKVPRLYLKNYF